MRLLSLLLISILMMNCKKTEETKEELLSVLVGTYTQGKSEGIYQLKLSPTSGELKSQQLVAATSSPSYLIRHPQNKDIILAVNEDGEGAITSFRWDENQTQLNEISTTSSYGGAPCHLAFAENTGLLAIANYMGGNAVTYSLDADGNFSQPQSYKFDTLTLGTHQRQESPHIHYVAFSPKGTHLYAVDLATDQVYLQQVSAESTPASNFEVALTLASEDGPRHLAFHPRLPLVYIVNELSNTIVACQIAQDSGVFQEFGRYFILPSDFREHSQAAAIKISPDGQFLYASNRGHNSLVIFKINRDGTLLFVAHESTRGDWPRDFSITPDGKYLFLANERSHDIQVFDRDKSSGQLTHIMEISGIESPTCILF